MGNAVPSNGFYQAHFREQESGNRRCPIFSLQHHFWVQIGCLLGFSSRAKRIETWGKPPQTIFGHITGHIFGHSMSNFRARQFLFPGTAKPLRFIVKTAKQFSGTGWSSFFTCHNSFKSIVKRIKKGPQGIAKCIAHFSVRS